MATSFVGSSLRRLSAPTGVLGLLCLVVAATSFAATPTPDPPPSAIAPEAPPAAKAPAVTVQRTPVATPAPAPVVRRPAPVVRSTPTVTPSVQPKPAAKPKATPRVAKRGAAAPEHVVVQRTPHDRRPVPLAAFVVAEELFDRGLLAVAGFSLLLVALGGAVLLGVARRQLLAAGLLLVLLAPAAQAAVPPTSALTGTAGSNGWFRSNVTVRWTVDPNGLVNTTGCPVAEQITAEGVTTRQCKADYSDGSSFTSAVVSIRIDKTAPVGVSGALARAADSDGWYNHPVAASFSGQDAVSGLAACSSGTYSGSDSASASLSGTCTDVAGNTSAPASVALKYDATAPAVTPTPERPPDTRKGWYRKPVTFSFAGADATSGVAGCSAPARYAGPDVAQASVSGSCRDRAGNAAEAKYAFQYDATAPKLALVKAKLATGVARLDWERAGDVVRVEIVRTPGVNGAKSTTVYQGNGAVFSDRTVKPGVRYRYLVSVADAAGNVAQKAVTTAEPSALLGPAAGAVVRTPPVLRWQAVKGATFYNVQLYRNGLKVLSTWPGKATLKLKRTWVYGGKRRQLVPGTYRWYVWGARGTKAKPTYGKALGTSTFVVKR